MQRLLGSRRRNVGRLSNQAVTARYSRVIDKRNIREEAHVADFRPPNYYGLSTVIACSRIPYCSRSSMALPPDISFADSLKRDQRRAFYEAHKDIALVMILVVFLFPIVGVNVSGLLGAAWGVVTSILAYYLMPYVTLKLGA